MQFKKTDLADVYLMYPDKKSDERGFFTRAWCIDEFRKIGIQESFVQANIGYNSKKNTLRGFHYQIAPHEEAKLIRCTSGKIYDVIIDLRSTSPTYLKWQSFILDAEDHITLFVPKGFAHAYMTLADNTEVYYMVSGMYTPEAERGIRWDDPAFSVKWPEGGPTLISRKDKNCEDYIL